MNRAMSGELKPRPKIGTGNIWIAARTLVSCNPNKGLSKKGATPVLEDVFFRRSPLLNFVRRASSEKTKFHKTLKHFSLCCL